MFLGCLNELVTAKRLIGSRWRWFNQRGDEFSKSFYFGDDGLIKVYKCHNEHSWTLKDGILSIHDASRDVFWLFDIVFEADDQLALVAKCVKFPDWPWHSLMEYRPEREQLKTEPDTLPEAVYDSSMNEGIRLVIWDLDETFWRGTLTEGGVTPVVAHHDLVRALNQRGIMNAVCSKNDFDEAKTALQTLDIWDQFVLSEISFSPKGAMIKKIIKNSQLRPETVMFIDDNRMNLEEALHYVPKLNIAMPDFIPALLADPRFVGKPDPTLKRLSKYKILQSKLDEQSRHGGDNEQFLRTSDIRLSFHTNVEDEFPRIHELVNRTNQLNYTKNRWPEDAGEALAVFRSQSEVWGTQSGYVKVSDRFGSYGIVGFYMYAHGECIHFLFSCRTMNMGVEQYVWSCLGKPFIAIRGTVASDVDGKVDWITTVSDADAANAALLRYNKTICVRGACDLMVASQFLRTKFDTIEEFNYPYQGWDICSVPRAIALHDEVKLPQNRALLSQLPGMPENRFESDVVTGRADAYVLSFSQETFYGLYRSKTTGMTLPLQHQLLWPWAHQKVDYTKISYDELLKLNVTGVSRQQWDFLINEFEFLGGHNPTMFEFDVRRNLSILAEKERPTIVLGLNDKIGRDEFVLQYFGRVNRLVRPIAEEFGCAYIDVTEFIHSENDLANDGHFGGPHFSRQVYSQIADRIFELLMKIFRADGGSKSNASVKERALAS